MSRVSRSVSPGVLRGDFVEKKRSVANAQLLGYEGDEPEEAEEFIDQLFWEIERVSEVSWRRFCGVDDPFIDREVYVRNFIDRESLNISEIYPLLLGKGPLAWEMLSQYLLKRWSDGTATDYVPVDQAVKNFCYMLTEQEQQTKANLLLGRLGAINHNVLWDSKESIEILHQAVENGREDIVRCFLIHGIDIQYVLDLAVMKNQLSLVSYLLQEGALIEPETLMSALDQENKEMAWHLSQGGADLDCRVQESDLSWTTPLIYYAKRNRLHCVKILVDLGAQMDFVDSEGKTALMHTLELGHEGVACYLFKKSDSKEFKEQEKELLEHYVDKRCSLAVQKLVSLGVCVSEEALRLAEGDEELTKFLQVVIEQTQVLADFSSIASPVDINSSTAKREVPFKRV